MANLERLPTAKYVRQCGRMMRELSEWQRMYQAAAFNTYPDHRSGKYEDREAVLGEAIRQLELASEALRTMPRLS